MYKLSANNSMIYSRGLSGDKELWMSQGNLEMQASRLADGLEVVKDDSYISVLSNWVDGAITYSYGKDRR